MRKYVIKILLSFTLIFFLAFTFKSHNVSGWYFQSIPPLHGANITDMAFTDSLTGYIITTLDSLGNTSYILKTTNGGDNWNIKYQNNLGFTKVRFIDNQTGFVGCVDLLKTTNGGDNWFTLTPEPRNSRVKDMSIVNENEIWITDPGAIEGGLYRTTNGGMNWETILYDTFGNPEKIYMYNSRLGFIYNAGNTYRTTNSGLNWTLIPGQNSDPFIEMKFVDSLTGWKVRSIVKKTIDGGMTWEVQDIPGTKQSPGVIVSFSIINKDTLWGCGGYEYISSTNYHARVYKTTNGGLNWGYQTPSPTLNSGGTYYLRFSDKNHGWTYFTKGTGFHTSIGGNDTTIYTGVSQISSEVPNNYKLYQNYPNPFNPVTIINYELKTSSHVSLKIFDINGKEVSILINQKQNAGKYEYTFDGSNLSSGIYFYTLQTNTFQETKKMILMK